MKQPNKLAFSDSSKAFSHAISIHTTLMQILVPALLVLFQVTSCASRVQAQDVKPEMLAPGVISGPVNDAAATFTPDGKTVYFHRGGPALGTFILISHLQPDGKWSTPDIAPFSGQWQDIEPVMAPDGSYLIFSSNRPATPGGKAMDGDWGGQHYPGGGGNLWRVDRNGDSWSEPHRLPDIINGSSATFSPAVTADGTLYFMKPLANTGHFHLFRAAYRNGQYEEPLPVPFSAPDSLGDVDPTVAPDESFLIFSSSRTSSSAPVRGQLFIVFRKNGKWGAPVNMGEAVNRSTYNNEAKLGPDHRTLYFASAYGREKATYPTNPNEVKQKLAESQWDTGAMNIWSVPLDKWLNAR